MLLFFEKIEKAPSKNTECLLPAMENGENMSSAWIFLCKLKFFPKFLFVSFTVRIKKCLI